MIYKKIFVKQKMDTTKTDAWTLLKQIHGHYSDTKEQDVKADVAMASAITYPLNTYLRRGKTPSQAEAIANSHVRDRLLPRPHSCVHVLGIRPTPSS